MNHSGFYRRWFAMTPDTLAASVVVMFLFTILQRGVGFGRSIIFCRWLDAEQLGQWDMAFGFLMLAAPVAVLSLPGTFGRYAEHHRRKNQLRVFLRRVLAVTGLLTVAASAAVFVGREQLSSVIFGRPDCVDMVALLALALIALIHFNVVLELFTALRLQRVASGLALFNVVVFAVAGIILLLTWEPTAQTVLISFTAASALTGGLSWLWLSRCWHETETSGPPMPLGSFWSRLLRFAAWLWLINWLANLFMIADRYMIVHHAGLPSSQALELVGQYHAARLMPLLLLNAAAMFATVVTPHLSRVWELGMRQKVVANLNVLFKVAVFGLTAAGVVVLGVAPLFFDVALNGRFATGQHVLPWALVTAIFAAALILAQLYLVCAERMRLSGTALAFGLVLNVGLNSILLPRLGLVGAVISTCIAHAAALLMVLIMTQRIGMRWDRGVWFVLPCPLVLVTGGAGAVVVLGMFAAVAVCTSWIFSRREKAVMWKAIGQLGERLGRTSFAPSAPPLVDYVEANG